MLCDEVKLAFEMAAKWSELLIGLATGLIGLSITFTKDILKGAPRSAFAVLIVAWLVLGVSVFYGFGHHGGLIGDLAFNDEMSGLRQAASAASPPQCYTVRPSVDTMVEGRRQWYAFFGGTCCLMVYGVIGFGRRSFTPPTRG